MSLVASGIYLINDLHDVDADRAHPRKKFRAIASGLLPASHAKEYAIGLIMAGLLLALMLNSYFLAVVATYFAMTLAYTFVLKRIFIIDIFTLAGLYTIRLVAGGAATGIELSMWIMIFSIFVFFCLAALKRQVELLDYKSRASGKIDGRNYGPEDLNIVSIMAVASGYISVLVLALYVNSPAVGLLYHTPVALLSLCVLHFFWINHMIIQTHRRQMNDDPLVYAVKDKISLAVVALSAVSVAWAALA